MTLVHDISSRGLLLSQPVLADPVFSADLDTSVELKRLESEELALTRPSESSAVRDEARVRDDGPALFDECVTNAECLMQIFRVANEKAKLGSIDARARDWIESLPQSHNIRDVYIGTAAGFHVARTGGVSKNHLLFFPEEVVSTQKSDRLYGHYRFALSYHNDGTKNEANRVYELRRFYPETENKSAHLNASMKTDHLRSEGLRFFRNGYSGRFSESARWKYERDLPDFAVLV